MKIRRILALLAALMLCLGAACAEVPAEKLDVLSPERQTMLDCALAQAAAWQVGFEAHYRPEFGQAGAMDAELLEGIASIPVEYPTSAVFFELKGAQEMDAAQRSAFLGQTGICNSLVRYLEGTFLEATSLYAVEDVDFDGVCYVVLCYAPEQPVIVSAICEAEDAAIVKTGAVHGFDQYENAFLAFVGPLMTRFGEDAFEISSFRPGD